MDHHILWSSSPFPKIQMIRDGGDLRHAVPSRFVVDGVDRITAKELQGHSLVKIT
jgi:hypothetical protein